MPPLYRQSSFSCHNPIKSWSWPASLWVYKLSEVHLIPSFAKMLRLRVLIIALSLLLIGPAGSTRYPQSLRNRGSNSQRGLSRIGIGRQQRPAPRPSGVRFGPNRPLATGWTGRAPRPVPAAPVRPSPPRYEPPRRPLCGGCSRAPLPGGGSTLPGQRLSPAVAPFPGPSSSNHPRLPSPIHPSGPATSFHSSTPNAALPPGFPQEASQFAQHSTFSFSEWKIM